MEVQAQLRENSTSAVELYSPPGTGFKRADALILLVCNTSGAAATYRIFFDESGALRDESKALYWDRAIAADVTHTLSLPPLIDHNGSIGVRSSVANALTYTLQGNEV